MKNIQKEVNSFMKTRGWDTAAPVHFAKSISIESAELLEHFQWNDLSTKEILKDKIKKSDIADEIADILIYTYLLCNELNLDHTKIILDKLKKINKKYPVDLIKRDSSQYLKIKKQYRK